MKYRLFIAALILPLLNITVAAKEVAPEISNPFTAERNKAVGNLSTSVVILQKMGIECKNQGKLSEGKIKGIQDKWIERNKTYLQMQADYMNGYFSTIRQFEGEKQAQTAASEMKKLFNDQANNVIKVAMEKEGKATACQKYFQSLEDKKMDIKKNHPDYKTLNEMVEYSKNNTPKTTNQ